MAIRVLVASIGNPPPYSYTFHSAGHVLCNALNALLGHGPFTRSISPTGLTSAGPAYTLYQSPVAMNISGKPVASAYKAFLRSLPEEERATAKLVVLHDDLETGLGRIKLKVGGSARGHNGIKDCMRAMGEAEFARIGVGIGRPASREPRDVAAYVLRKMTAQEMVMISDRAEVVLRLLEKMREGQLEE